MAEWQQITKEKIENKINELKEKGVIIPVLDGIIIDDLVEIGKNTVILPGTVILGTTKIGEGCVIGPNSYVENSEIGDNTIFKASYSDNSKIGNQTRIGPFCNIRPNCNIANEVKIGDFVEVKNSNIGNKTSVAHLTYVGDSDVGEHCNFGCGVVTVNYDGKKKYRTTIGNDVFIGCNVNLVAPVTVHDDCYIAAGSTITDDVPSNALAIARSRQLNKENWLKKEG